MKRFYYVLLFIFLQNVFFVSPKEYRPEQDLREEFLRNCPDSISNMIGGYHLAGLQKQAQRAQADYSISNGDGTFSVGASFSTGNIILDALPAPVRAAIAIGKFIWNFKQEASWIAEMFGISQKVTSEVAHKIINAVPYLKKIHQRTYEIERYLYTANSEDLPTRLKARIGLLETDLPPPYNKHFIKGQKKFRKVAADENGRVLGYRNKHDVYKIFKKYVSQGFTREDLFAQRIPEMRNSNGYASRNGSVSWYHHQILDFIEQASTLSFRELNNLKEEYSNNSLVRELFDYYVQRRFNNCLGKIQQDPLYRKEPNNRSYDRMAELIARSEYQKKLETAISHTAINNQKVKDALFDALDGLVDDYEISKNYYFAAFDAFMQNVSSDDCSQEVKDFFLDESGLLKKYAAQSYVQTHFAGKLSSNKLCRAVNYSLLISDTRNYRQSSALAEEILHKAHLSVHASDKDYATMYENDAYDLYQQLVAKKDNWFYVDSNMNKEETQRFDQMHIQDNTHGQSRQVAYEKTQEECCRVYQKEHQLDKDVREFMADHHINRHIFYRMTGTTFQHHMTSELITIIHRAVSISTGPFIGELSAFIDLAQNHNIAKKTWETVTITDICWGLLRYGEYIKSAVTDAGKNFYENVLCHPIRYLQDAGEGIAKLGLRTAKYFYDIEDENFQEVYGTEQYIAHSCRSIVNQVREMSGPERAYCIAYFLTDMWLTRKTLSCLGKVFNGAMRGLKKYPRLKASQLLEFIPQEVEVAEAFLGETIYYCQDDIKKIADLEKGVEIIQVGHSHKIPRPESLCSSSTAELAVFSDAKVPIASPESFTQSALIVAKEAKQLSLVRRYLPVVVIKISERVKEITKSVVKKIFKLKKKPDELIISSSQDLIFLVDQYSKSLPTCYDCVQQVDFLQKTYSGEVVKVFGESWKVFYRMKHYMQPEVNFQKGRLFDPRVKNLHFDCKGRIERCKGDVLIFRQKERDGFYIAAIKAFGVKNIIEKTFFPVYWSAEDIFNAIKEALMNAVLESEVALVGKRFYASGYTNHGVKMIFCISRLSEKSLEIVSVYPDKGWILEGS